LSSLFKLFFLNLRCNSKIYCEKPIKWLNYVLDLIKTEESKLKLISTRRGGGLPFFVQAIVSTELVENGRKSLSKCMKTLLELAERNYENDDDNFSKVCLFFNKRYIFDRSDSFDLEYSSILN
jgi:hypothetical protein